ncbi:hypothetical protein CHGG_09869 [Chaetomium globosum CBS 148.51]|uniref:DUF1993 domain-containing protein n=1 Tax=Chaetomium globosum (strain ATCC 6205 / CBS 148.51 / DSM 1962 / NBRC 6347 / NRRL 1970) TaxID=306901 RepID=Q2GQ85_CHAGB|nr:uncharacterized protein CHGG_09869 [Chaetomium globosum CBS 148.51]EAQ83465.1 hypothetical protein CHGG_09869 [Chaetomium globosum CBS 148.51]
MASVSLYDVSIGMTIQTLDTLVDLLKKAQEHPEAATLADTRLIDDMKPFSFQIIAVTNFAKKYVERLTGRKVEVWEDNETTLEQLLARVNKTLDLLKAVSREEVDGSDRETVSLQVGPYNPVDATPSQYVLGFAIPNIMFHLTMAYGLLRMKGIELGKRDFMNHYMADWFKPTMKEQ